MCETKTEQKQPTANNQIWLAPNEKWAFEMFAVIVVQITTRKLVSSIQPMKSILTWRQRMAIGKEKFKNIAHNGCDCNPNIKLDRHAIMREALWTEIFHLKAIKMWIISGIFSRYTSFTVSVSPICRCKLENCK